MATKQEIKQYLAHWFQLGKKVLVSNGKISLLPQPVLTGNKYSTEFEKCWQEILASGTGDCHLEGTQETIADLLTPAWEVVSCGRCAMPVPIRSMGMPVLMCPCFYLPTWPNTEVPAPRGSIDEQEQLQKICDRLLGKIPSAAALL
jgi:hypothetical protein